MSYISSKDFSEIRKSISKRRNEILSAIESKKSISKKQCQQWIEDICDLVLTYDPTVSLSSPSMQPFIKLVDIDANNSYKNSSGPSVKVKTSTKPSTSSSVEENDNEVVVINEEEDKQPEWPEIVAKSSATEGTAGEDGVRYKGVIRGIDSLNGNNSDDDWSTEPPKSPPKKSKNNRRTRSQAKTSNDQNDKETNGWSTGGQVLGGDTKTEASSLSAEEKRRLMAEKTEQRLAQMTRRGAKGVVRLSTRAQPDIEIDNNSKLQWKI